MSSSKQTSAGQTSPGNVGPSGPSGLPGAFTARQVLTYQARVQAAQTEIGPAGAYDVPDDCPLEGCTPDELSFPAYAASFHKLLPHDPANGLLTDDGTADSGVENYGRLLEGLEIETPSSDFDSDALNALTLLNRQPSDPPGARPRVLINPRSSKALNVKGPDIASLDAGSVIYGADYAGNLLDEISLRSGPSAAEMVEVYAMALLRGLPFVQYPTPPASLAADVDLVVAALNEFGADFIWGYPNFDRLTAQDLPVDRANLFRGATPGARAGDYLSVFLTFKRPALFPSGCAPAVADLIGAGQFADLLGQPLQVPQGQDRDFGRTLADYAKIQNAFIPEKYPPGYFSGLGPISTGRNLGDYVHVDNAYEEYIRAADILVAHQYPRSPHSPYARYPSDPSAPPVPPYYENEGDGPTLGPGDAWGLVGGVRGVAERAAWTQKYLVARRARPEVMAALIHLAKNGRADLQALLHPRLFAAGGQVDKLLERIKQWNLSRGGEGYLLPQMFPEGSPAHPSWPSGHATIAGACVTVLKAIFDDCHFVIDPNSPPGTAQPYPSAAAPLYLHDELDKLATNVAFGRNFAGVHFRSDGEHGILLGEEVAIRYLQDHLREYREEFREVDGCAGFTLTRRNGLRICITADGVCPAADCSTPANARIHPKAQL